MNRTKIEWCKNPDGTQGYTWNPITGCLNNCSYCYARKLANGRLKSRMEANFDLAGVDCAETDCPHCPSEMCEDPFYPRLWKGRLRNISYSETQRGIFVCSMGELFGPTLPPDWTGAVLEQCRRHPDDRFYLLTKQPQELAKWSPFPDNCWVGVSVTNETDFQRAMNYLPYVQAKVRYLSIEPFLGRILTTKGQLERYIDWLIIGAQTKPTVMPEREWVREVVKAADVAGIPVFLKDSISPLTVPVEWSSPWMWDKASIYGTKLRQEMPNED